MIRRQQLIARVTAAFVAQYGCVPDLLVAAPGRVNLIGDHTDYNDGLVLPAAIDYESILAIGDAPEEGDMIHAIAVDYNHAPDALSASAPFAHQHDEWKNHLRGVVASMAARGLVPKAARLAFAGNVPQGAGLSSSASLNVVLAKGFAAHNQFADLGPTDIAKIARASENDFVGCACGIMDQLVSARAVADSALLIDCRSLDATPVTLPDDWAIVVMNSHIRRELVTSAYNQRRAQCMAAAAHFGVPMLRDVTMAMLHDARHAMDDLIFRRARHVITENQRVLDSIAAIAAGDMAMISRQMAASHASLRDDFAVSVAGIDELVADLSAFLGEQAGVRMTGGGFGGCVVALVRQGDVDRLMAHVKGKVLTGASGPVRAFQCRTMPGAAVL